MHYAIFAIIGLLTGLLMALFGIGGGAFIVPALDAAFFTVPSSDHPPFQLIVIGSLCTIVIGSLPRAIGVLVGNKNERGVAKLLILSALPFILTASLVATQLTDKTLRLGFSATIALIGLWTLFGKAQSKKAEIIDHKPNTYKLISVGAISGISSALFGLGGGNTPDAIINDVGGLADCSLRRHLHLICFGHINFEPDHFEFCMDGHSWHR